MSRRRKLGRVTRDRWFESGLLQRRVCELLVPKRRSPIDNASSKDKFVPQVEQRRFLSFRPSGASRRAAIGGGAVTRGSCLAAMDQPAKLTIAKARSGMPCRVGENTRVISSGLRKMSKGRGADSVNTAVLHRGDAVGETVDPGIMCHDDDRPIGSERRIL